MGGRLKRLVRNGFRFLGYDISRYAPPVPGPESVGGDADFADQDRQIIESAKAFTDTGLDRMLALINAVRYVVKYDIPGAIVECGVWRGGSMMIVARTLLALGVTSRPLYLFDTFEGMPPPQKVDVNFLGMKASEKYERVTLGEQGAAWCYASLNDVRNAMRSTGYDMQHVRFIKGKVEDTVPHEAPELIAILRLDTDWYESTRHELVHLYPRLADTGVLIIDDYGHWAGARQAVDEYFAALTRPVFLHRIDYTGRLVIKRT